MAPSPPPLVASSYDPAAKTVGDYTGKARSGVPRLTALPRVRRVWYHAVTGVAGCDRGCGDRGRHRRSLLWSRPRLRSWMKGRAMQHVVETERLILRRFMDADVWT